MFTTLLWFTPYIDKIITGTCEGTYEIHANEITSPFYPGYYGKQNCRWKIVAPVGDVKLYFIDFELESVKDTSTGSETCHESGSVKDQLSIFDGEDRDAWSLGTFCGDRIPSNITSSGRSLYLEFNSDDFVNKKGFKLKFEITGTIKFVNIYT